MSEQNNQQKPLTAAEIMQKFGCADGGFSVRNVKAAIVYAIKQGKQVAAALAANSSGIPKGSKTAEEMIEPFIYNDEKGRAINPERAEQIAIEYASQEVSAALAEKKEPETNEQEVIDMYTAAYKYADSFGWFGDPNGPNPENELREDRKESFIAGVKWAEEQRASLAGKKEPRECWTEKMPIPCSDWQVKEGLCGCNIAEKKEPGSLPDLFGEPNANIPIQGAASFDIENLPETDYLNVNGTLFIQRAKVVKIAADFTRKQTASLREQLERFRNENNSLSGQIQEAYKLRDKWAVDSKKGWEYSERLAKLLDEQKGLVAEKDARIKELEETVVDFTRIMRYVYWKPNTDEMGVPQEPFYDDSIRGRIEYEFKHHSIPLILNNEQHER